MSVSRTAFTRIHRDALPTSEKKNERKARNARIAFAPRYGSRPVPAMHFSSHIGRRPVVGERARLVARSLQRVQREEDRQGGHTERGEKGRERGAAACLAACPSHSLLSPLRVSPFSPCAFAPHLPSFPSFTTLHERRNALHVVQKKLKFFFQKTIAGYCRMYGDDKK